MSNLSKKIGRKSAFRLNVESMITAFILAMVIRTFVICPFKIPSSSMYPTLYGDPNNGDRILVDRFRYLVRPPVRGDIVVFKTRGIEGLDQDKDYIKRLVGLPGEKLFIKDDHLYINDHKVEIPEFFKTKEYSFHKNKGMLFGDPGYPVKIPEDCFFVMGDNTENSKDSRFFGFVPRKNVTGKALLIYWPVKRAGMLK